MHVYDFKLFDMEEQLEHRICLLHHNYYTPAQIQQFLVEEVGKQVYPDASIETIEVFDGAVRGLQSKGFIQPEWHVCKVVEYDSTSLGDSAFCTPIPESAPKRDPSYHGEDLWLLMDHVVRIKIATGKYS